MKVSLWRRNLQSFILFTLSAVLLLPATMVGAMEGAGVEGSSSIELVTIEPELPAMDSAGENLVVPEPASSIALQTPVQDTLPEKVSVIQPELTLDTPKDAVATVQTEPSPIQPEDPVLISSLQVTDGAIDFLQLYNTTSKIVDVSDLSLTIVYHSVRSEDPDVTCDVAVDGYMLGGRHLALVSDTVSGEGTYPLGACGLHASGAMTIELRRTSAVHPTVNPEGVIERLYVKDFSGQATKYWLRTAFSASKRTGIFSKDFSTGLSPVSLEADSLYRPPQQPKLTIVEILPSAQACPTNDTNLLCRSYIKVLNDSDKTVDLSLYRIRGGELGVSSTSSNTSQLSGKITAHSFVIINQDVNENPLSLNKSAGTVWFEDAYGVQAYQNSVMPYEKASTVAWSGKAWAYDARDTTWKWAMPSPTTLQANFSIPEPNGLGSAAGESLKPCDANQYRNPETNRCNTISSATSTLRPCTATQFRNPATNRCNNMASTSSTLESCEADEFRNPATNRCKKLVSTTSTLQPCETGYERNSETNRCRKISVAGAISAKTNFPVESMKDSAKSFVGWWALGGLLILGLGYASWEWRHELMNAIRAISTKLSSKGK